MSIAVRRFLHKLYDVIAPIYMSVFIIGVIISTMAFVVGWATTRLGHPVNPFSFISDPAVEFLYQHRYQIVSFVAVLGLIWLFALGHRGKSKWKRITSRYDLCNLDYIRFLDDFTNELLRPAAGHSSTRHLDYDKVVNLSKTFLRTSVNQLSKLMTLYTGHQCHVSIKVFDEKTSIWTYLRDELTDNNRKLVDEHLMWYDYKENTAFEEILDNPKCRIFWSNHLWLQAIRGKYKNANSDWWKFYNATIVVPITDKTHAGAVTTDNVLGFVCVDNKGGGFDGGACVNILSGFARVYYGAFSLANRVQQIQS
jgi:hypothetical protein